MKIHERRRRNEREKEKKEKYDKYDENIIGKRKTNFYPQSENLS